MKRLVMVSMVLAALACRAVQVVEANEPKVVAVNVNAVQAVNATGDGAARRDGPVPASVAHGSKVTEVKDERVVVYDDKFEEVTTIVTRNESRVRGAGDGKKAAPAQAAVDVAVGEPRPPVPPTAEALEARRLVRYFCRCWKDGDYERMWWAMSPRYRLKVQYDEFLSVFAEDARGNGGLMDENIGPDERHDDWGVTLDVELRFRMRRAKTRKAKAFCERTKDGYRIGECGIIPLDMENL